MTFAVYMEEVDRCLDQMCGVVSSDLPDFEYMDWYEEGADPSDTADAAFDASH